MTNKTEIYECRAAFEAWYDTTPSRAIERNGERYILMQTELSWCAWQAAWNTCAEPAAPPSDEVDRAFSTLERYDTFHQHHTGYDSSAEIKTIRDHIAALEEGIEALSSANESFAKRIANLATENKRLREVLTKYATADVTCSYVEVSSRAYEVHEHCEKWAQAALAQTDGLKECRVCDGAGYHLIPTTGYGCCGNYLSSGECCGNAVQVDTGPERQPCADCNGTGKESLAKTNGKAGE